MTEERKKRIGVQDKWTNRTKERVRHSRKSEERVAGLVGGKRLARSGAKAWSKWDTTTDRGDIANKDFHIEHKETEKDSLSIKRAWLAKVAAGAQAVNKEPVLWVTFHSAGQPPQDWVMFPLSVAKQVFETIAKDNLPFTGDDDGDDTGGEKPGKP